MIVPNVRTTFDRADAAFVIWLVTRGDETARERARQRLDEEGLDAILDDPRTFNALMAAREFSSAQPGLVFYLLVRHALLESGVGDRVLADYLATLLVTFGRNRRAFRPDDEVGELTHLVDIVAAGDDATGERAFLLRAHLGEFALWLSGLFPDHITARVQRRGAPGLAYYEQLGASGYRMAADYTIAQTHGLDRVYRDCADGFPVLRTALNRIADRH
ncbi:MAG: hypothetical protein ACRELX_04550, partial [Longimicrobiales bacterium]